MQDSENEPNRRNSDPGTFLSRSFYHLIGNACHLDMGDGKGDFRMMNRAMTEYFGTQRIQPLYERDLLFRWI